MRLAVAWETLGKRRKFRDGCKRLFRLIEYLKLYDFSILKIASLNEKWIWKCRHFFIFRAVRKFMSIWFNDEIFFQRNKKIYYWFLKRWNVIQFSTRWFIWKLFPRFESSSIWLKRTSSRSISSMTKYFEYLLEILNESSNNIGKDHVAPVGAEYRERRKSQKAPYIPSSVTNTKFIYDI